VKEMRFGDIPQFTQPGNWECDYDFASFVKFIEKAEITEKLEMNPDFQRGHVWTVAQQIAYIEFLLKGGKTARTIYLNHSGWQRSEHESDSYVCVDGLQRATAIKGFVNNEFRVFGYLYNEFEGSPRIMQGVRININDLKTRKDVLQWYLEFNSGGTIHTPEELERVKALLAIENMDNGGN
jgi:hypothetical protein